MSYLGGLVQLRRLAMQGTGITSGSMPIVGRFSELQALDVAWTAVGSQGECCHWLPGTASSLVKTVTALYCEQCKGKHKNLPLGMPQDMLLGNSSFLVAYFNVEKGRCGGVTPSSRRCLNV